MKLEDCPSGDRAMLDKLISNAQQIVDSKASYECGSVPKEVQVEYARFYLFIRDIADMKPRPTKPRACRVVNSTRIHEIKLLDVVKTT